MFNILVTFRDIDYLGKLIMGILPIYKGYLPVYFKGYGIFGTPLYKPQLYRSSGMNESWS